MACPLPQKDWATLLHFFYHYRYLLVTNYLAIKLLLLIISVFAEITLLKTACHFLLLLVGFDTLTYQKELQLIPYNCWSSVTRLIIDHNHELHPPGEVRSLQSDKYMSEQDKDLIRTCKRVNIYTNQKEAYLHCLT